MAVAFGTSTSLASQTATSITLSFTPGSATDLLCVGLMCNSNTARAGGSPTFGGVAMTQSGIRQVAAGGAAVATEMWYITAGTTSATNIVVPNTGAINITIIAASFSLGKPEQQLVQDLAGGGVGNGTNPTNSVTSTYSGDAYFSVVCTLGGALTAGASRTLITNGTAGTLFYGGEYFLQAAAGAAAMNWTAATGRWAQNIITIREASFGRRMLLGVGS